MEKIIIEAKQPRALKKALISLLFLILSICFFIIGMKDKKTLFWMLGFMATIYFLITFLIYFGRTRNRKPLITISFDGIIDSTSNSVGYIFFKDIKKFTMIECEGRRVLGIEPKNYENYIKKLPPVKRKEVIERLENKEHPFIIDVDNAKDMTIEDIYTLLKKRLGDYSSLYD